MSLHNAIYSRSLILGYNNKLLCQWLKHALLCLICCNATNLMAAERLEADRAGIDRMGVNRMVAPQDPNAQDAGNGSPSAPYKTLSYAMSQLRPGDHLTIAAGTYRDALVFPQKPWTRITAAAIEAANINSAYLLKNNETVIEGQGTVLIKGSDIVNDWRALGVRRYMKPWADEPQQVFVDGKPLIQVAGTIFEGFPEKQNHPLLALHKSQKGIWPGRINGNQDSMPDNSFYYDRTGKTLYIKPALTKLKGHVVEVSTRPILLSGNGVTDIVVKNLTFQHSNTSTNLRAGLILMTGLRISLENLRVSEADATGISLMGDDITLRNSSANNCGQLGIKGRGKRMQLIDNETNGNNTRGFNKWWEAGGAKFIGNGGLQDSLISGHKALGNFGDGIWFDWKNRNNTVQNSLSAYNHGFGIHYEASDRGRIINNVVVANEQRGIYLPHSSDSIIAYNLVASNGLQGIAIVDEGRRDPDGVFDMSARGNKVFSNIIAWNASPLVLPTKLVDNVSDGNVFIGDADQTKPGLGWVNMFHEELIKWTTRTSQDRHSINLENTVDDAFNKSLSELSPEPDLAWYQILRNTLKPLAVNPDWPKLTPEITDLRPGPMLQSFGNLKMATKNSIYQSIMTPSQAKAKAEDSAVARQGAVDKVSIDLKMATKNSIDKSIMMRRQAEDSAVARQGAVDKVSIDL